ncbi:MAG TPA: hypothetical protein HPP83_02775 [Candidatus Hydrogenedentes bacterium]|nr:hypothetical protein [Candidatus Hydrogenedentota bacterium]
MKHVRRMSKPAPPRAEVWQTWICELNRQLIDKGGEIPIITVKCDYPEDTGTT